MRRDYRLSVADTDQTTTERVWINSIGHQPAVFLDSVAGGSQARVEKSSVGDVGIVQVANEGHDALAVERLETCTFARLWGDAVLHAAAIETGWLHA